MANAATSSEGRPASWKWIICGLLLCATMLNYMDRQTLSLTITEISAELGLNNEQYGWLETSFGMAFAVGAVVFGLLVDRVGVRWLYPLVFVGWSAAGIATAFAAVIGKSLAGFVWDAPDSAQEAYVGLFACRTMLGLFEAGHWPCALVTTQRLLSRADRSFGNSLLQSGASVGAILTPIVVQMMVSDAAGSWRGPYMVIGAIGMLWIVPWLLLVRSTDLQVGIFEEAIADSATTSREATSRDESSEGSRGPNPYRPPANNHASESNGSIVPRFVALVVTVIAINMTWQYFRVWMPKFLREFHGYDRTDVNWFTSAYYISTDIGCLAVGAAVKWMTGRGTEVHRARMITFFFCALLTSLGLIAAILPRSPFLLGILLAIGFGALGVFPNYYAFTQELSLKRQGMISGALGAITWVVTSIMQTLVGRNIDQTKSYALGIGFVGFGPVLGWLALATLWNRSKSDRTRDPSP